MNTSARWMRPVPGWRSALLGVGLGLLAAAPLAAQVSREYDVKAAFLYNFITFTEWPGAAFKTPGSPYVIGIVGEDPFGSALDEIVNGEQIKGRPLVVRRFKQIEDVHQCHILFISASETRRIPDILRRLRGQPVLTVSDTPDFVEAGGAIMFTAKGRVGLVINPAALRAASLAVSSKLLRLAQLSGGGAAP